MAADVSTGEKRDERKEMVTRDLLGGGGDGGGEASHAAVVPTGGEQKLDLMSGNTAFQHPYPVVRRNYDLNLPPPVSAYESVCTLEKVKTALERAARESTQPIASPPLGTRSDGSPSSSSSIKRPASEEEETGGQDFSSGMMMLVACNGCLQYVLLSKLDPTCPRCGSHVRPSRNSNNSKKVRYDLNSSYDDNY